MEPSSPYKKVGPQRKSLQSCIHPNQHSTYKLSGLLGTIPTYLRRKGIEVEVELEHVMAGPHIPTSVLLITRIRCRQQFGLWDWLLFGVDHKSDRA